MAFVMRIAVILSAFSTCLASFDFFGDLRVPENMIVNLKSAEDRYDEMITVNTTVVMPYNKVKMSYDSDEDDDNRYRMGQDGYVYCFNMYSRHEEPVRISIWRYIDETFDSPYDAHDDMVYYQDAMKNGSYILVYITETIHPPQNQVYTVCMNQAVSVLQHDFLGLTFGTINPIPYSKDSRCENHMINVMQTCDVTSCVPDTDHLSWGSYDSAYNTEYKFSVSEVHTFKGVEVTCKNYAVQALFMPTMESNRYKECSMIQLTEQEKAYSVISHPEYLESSYDSDVDECWIIRSVNRNSMLHIQPVFMDLESAQEGQCVYDYVTVEDYKSGSHIIMTRYCGKRMHTFVVSDYYCVLRFHSDNNNEGRGFNVTVRSIPEAIYREYDGNSSYIWPWQRNVSEVTTTTASSKTEAVESMDSGFTMAEKIGIGIGIACLCLLLLLLVIVITYCFCKSMGNKKPKVQPEATGGLPKKKVQEAPTVSFAQYPAGPTEVVYVVPEPRYPPPYHLEPLHTSTARGNPPPYRAERYGPSVYPVVENDRDEERPPQISLPNSDDVMPVTPKRHYIHTVDDE